MSNIKSVILPLLLTISVAAAGCGNSSSRGGASSAAVSSAAESSESAASESSEAASSGLSALSADSAGFEGLEDGVYEAEVTLAGGSGKASVESPCEITVKNGSAEARIVWSSSHYDYMIVDGEKYLPVNESGNSAFEIPVTALDTGIAVQADTTAMSQAHLIDYTLTFHISENAAGTTGDEGNNIGSAGSTNNSNDSGEEASSSGTSESAAADSAAVPAAPSFAGLTLQSSDENDYAQCYRIYRYSGGYAVIAVNDGREYLLVPEGADVPEVAESDSSSDAAATELVVLQQPLDRIYLAATAVMCQFDSLDAVDRIVLSGAEEDDWSIDSAREAMADGSMLYGGKYSAPDYEQIVSMDCDLAIESTMILHTPKVQEKLEQLGIPVLIDRSSYEPEPLGRTEWVKVYGLLTGEEEKAEEAFSGQEQIVEQLGDAENTGKTVAVFSLNSSHQIVTRSAGDYYGKMIEQAGGIFVTPAQESGNAVSTVSVGIEDFYAAAADADFLIYNGTIEDVPESVSALESEDAIFSQFKAVQNGNVWYTDRSLYQNANRIGTLIGDLHTMLTGDNEETTYLHKMK